MLEKNVVGVEKKEDAMPTFKTDAAKQADYPPPVASVGAVTGISPVSIASGTVDAIDVWRYMSELYRDRRIQREQMKMQSDQSSTFQPGQAEKKFTENFQKSYENDSIELSKIKDHKSLMDNIMEKIWLANLDVKADVLIEPEKEEVQNDIDDGIIRVSRVMSTNVISVIDSTTIEQVTSLFNKKKITGVPVVHYLSKHLMGIISMSDIIKHIFEGKSISTFHTEGSLFMQDSLAILERPVRDYMEKNVITVDSDCPVLDACKLMAENNIHRIIVTDKESKVRGVFSSSDVVKLIAQGEIKI